MKFFFGCPGRISSLAIVLIFAVFGSGFATSGEIRDWEFSDGTAFTGELVEVSGDVIYLRNKRRNGHVSVNSLAEEEDRRFVGEFYRKQESERDILWGDSESTMAQLLKSRLFCIKEGFREEFLFPDRPEPDFYAIYFGASWCGPCRAFLASFKVLYQHWKESGLENFEVIFVSSDNSAVAQEKYMIEEEMPWPAVSFERERLIQPIKDVRASGIPNLVILDRDGNPLHFSYDGEDYRGAMAAADDLKGLLYRSNPNNRSVRKAKLRELLAVMSERADSPDAPPKVYYVSDVSSVMQRSGLEEVIIRVSISWRGYVEDVEIRSEAPVEVAEELRTRIKEWLFVPRVKDGRCVSSTVDIPVRF